MDFKDTLHRDAHQHPGGIDVVAVRLGCSKGTLYNKLNVNNSSNHITADELHALVQIVGPAALHAFCASLGYTCVKVDEQPAGDMAVLESVTNVWSTMGELGAQVHAALADHRIERHEVTAIEQAAFTAVRPIMQLLARVRGMAEQ